MVVSLDLSFFSITPTNWTLLDSFHTLNLRIAFPQYLFHYAFDGHLCAWTSRTVSLQSDFHNIVIRVFHKLDISPVPLQERPDLI